RPGLDLFRDCSHESRAPWTQLDPEIRVAAMRLGRFGIRQSRERLTNLREWEDREPPGSAVDVLLPDCQGEGASSNLEFCSKSRKARHSAGFRVCGVETRWIADWRQCFRFRRAIGETREPRREAG